MVQLPLLIDYNDVVDATGWVADVESAHWFPHGSHYTKVNNFPGSSRLLRNGYSVVTALDQAQALRNECVQGRFGLSVGGNVLVLRHAYYRPWQVTNLHSSERQFVDLLVERLVIESSAEFCRSVSTVLMNS